MYDIIQFCCFSLDFCPDGLSIGVNEVLKSPTINGLILIHVFKSQSTLFMKLGTPEFGAYMFRIIMFSWLTISLIEIKCSHLSLHYFEFEGYFSDIRKAISDSFLVQCDWDNFVHHFILRQCLSVKLRCVPCRQQINYLCFFIYLTTLCLLTGKLRPLIFKDILEICVLIADTVLFLGVMLSVVLCVLVNTALHFFLKWLDNAQSNLQLRTAFFLWFAEYNFLRLFKSCKVFLSRSATANILLGILVQIGHHGLL